MTLLNVFKADPLCFQQRGELRIVLLHCFVLRIDTLVAVHAVEQVCDAELHAALELCLVGALVFTSHELESGEEVGCYFNGEFHSNAFLVVAGPSPA
jgi:hypothetical protein